MQTSLTELLALEAIRDLATRYCHCMWERDLGVVDLYAPGGRFNEHRGREAIGRFYRAAFENPNLAARPYAANHRIELLGADRARGHCHADIRLVRDGAHVLYVGSWRDEYLRLGDSWYFEARDFALAYQVTIGRASG